LKDKKSVVLVLDSSIFINNIEILQLNYPLFTINELGQELISERAKLLFDVALINGRLNLIEPSLKSQKYIEKISRKTGDFYNLSKIDRKILALAWYIKNNLNFDPIVLTEDYSMQNILSKINIKYTSFVELGIKSLIHWEFYCPECRTIIKSPNKDFKCPNCGTKIKKRPKTIRRIKK